ncbi:MAG: hypothetical protein FWB91_05790 [Defluviitaleaceae bacterium]|nr:hypothetical protein [Defluviitaleaceae bacterium]
MNPNWLQILLSLLPLPLMIYVLFSASTSIEEENKKRIVAGKQAITHEEFQRRIKKARIIACAVLVLCWAVGLIVIYICRDIWHKIKALCV